MQLLRLANKAGDNTNRLFSFLFFFFSLEKMQMTCHSLINWEDREKKKEKEKNGISSSCRSPKLVG